jgi:hypothetical protein
MEHLFPKSENQQAKFIQFSVSTICINRKYLYNFYVTTCFGRYFWPSSVTLYIYTTFSALLSFHRQMFTFGGRSCMFYIV